MLPRVRANAGIQAWYRQQLYKAVKEMQDSVDYWLKSEYRSTGIAQDDSPAIALRNAIRRLSRQWQKKFDMVADSLSKRFVDKVLTNSDTSLRTAMADAGMTIKFTMTKPMATAYQAVIGEQVGLIKSIPSQHLTQVETLVMQSVQRGRDLGYLATELKARYGITQRRAALIARDQNNKATSTLQAARQQDLGIKQGVWRHSNGGKTKRPSHVAADGKPFDLSKGMYIDGEWIMPGEKINCKCGWQPVIPGFQM